jgi:polygalacturonase
MYGIEPSTTNIIGSGLDAMFAAGGDIRFEKPGTYLTDRAWVLRSGTRLWIGAGVILKAVDSYNGNILQNYSYAVNAGAGTADDFIEVWGPGTIDYNGRQKDLTAPGAWLQYSKT